MSNGVPAGRAIVRIEADAALFDSDGVLVDSHRQVDVAWNTLATEFGLDWGVIATQHVGVPARQTLARHLTDAPLAAAVLRLEELEVSTAEGTDPIGGAAELIAALPAGRWAVVTSATRRLGEARWAGAGLPLPAYAITADDVERGKPFPDPFLAGAALLGCAPERCVVFEDSPSGGAAATTAGAVVVQVGNQSWSVTPTARVRDLADVHVTVGHDGRLVLDISSDVLDPARLGGVTDTVTHYDAIEAYADAQSVAPGGQIGICVSTTAAAYDVVVERWGASREIVWEARGLPGVEQATPADADAAGCGWDISFEVPVGAGWRSGFHLVTLTAHGAPTGREVGHAGFVVRAGLERSPVLLVLATNTWNAYNDWGGRSLYTGGHEVSFRRPWGRGMLVRPHTERDDRKARPRRPGEEPDVDGEIYQAYRFEHGYPGYMGSAGWFTYDRRFVEWAEGVGYTLDYATSADLELVDGLLDGYALVVGAGHDEYWSARGRDAVEAFVAAGGNYASFSGNTMFWQVRLERGATSMVAYKYAAHTDDPVLATDPSAMTGMWSDPLAGRPERRFLGAASMYGLYSRFGRATARGVPGFVVYRDDHWLLAGTGMRYGDVLGADHGVVGYENVGTRVAFDDVNLPVAVLDPELPGDALPDAVEVVAMTPASNLAMGEYPKSIAALDDQGDLEFVAERVYGGGARALATARHGNAVILTCRPSGASGGQVVTVGSTDWVFGLDGDPAVGRLTANVLDRLGRAG